MAAVSAGLALAAAPAVAAGPCSRAAGSGGVVRIRSGGRSRTALVRVPAGTRVGVRLPVVLALHGAGKDGAWMESYTGLSAVAGREGFMPVYPDAVKPHPFWNYDADRNRPDDVSFLRRLIDHIESTRCVDSRRVYATGVSNGGGMAARIGCVLADRVAAIAPVAGSYAALPACAPARPVSVLEIHGTADRSAPYYGRSPSGAGSAPSYVAGWVDRDGCTGDPVVRKLYPHTRREDWVHCAPGVRVGHVRIRGGPHEWPGWPATAHPPRSKLSASWSVWRFFAKLRL